LGFADIILILIQPFSPAFARLINYACRTAFTGGLPPAEKGFIPDIHSPKHLYGAP
jgi:hypothetical protein